jgi:FkbM family methyltransferase
MGLDGDAGLPGHPPPGIAVSEMSGELPNRVIASGADRYRKPGAIERLADRLSRRRFNPSVRRRLKRLYLMALTAKTLGRGLPRVLPGGETVRVLPEYAYLSWNPDEYRAFREAVRPGMAALDVGANVGAYSMLLGQWAGSTGVVFAFEPAPQAFQGLLEHVRLNGLANVVKPIGEAVGDSVSTARFLVADSAGEGRLASRADTTAGVAVPVTTLDEFCATERISPGFIKIDVEGGELAVLRGARETIRAGRGRMALFVEMHPSSWPALGISREDVLTELRHQSLTVQGIAPLPDLWAAEGICLRLVHV